MDHRTVAGILYRIADYMEINGENPFKATAYRRAAQSVENTTRPLNEFASFTELNGVGKGTAAVIEELLRDGKTEVLEKLKSQIPSELLALTQIPGLGPKSAGRLYRELGVDSIEALKAAAVNGKIRTLSGFGARKEQQILEGIDKAFSRPERLPAAFVWPLAREMEAYVADHPKVNRVRIAGSLRRKSETVKDLDFIVSTLHPDEVSPYILSYPRILEVVNRGETKLSVEVEARWPITVDFRLVRPEQFAAALHHFTGSRQHNVQMRQRAKKKGWRLSEYGAENLETGESRTFESEQALFSAFDLPYLPPEVREGESEFVRAENGTLYKDVEILVSPEQIRGDLHIHTEWSDGAHSIETIAEAARQRGYEYIAVTDHSQSLKIAGGLEAKRLLEQKETIRRLNEQWDDFHILSGVEMDILPDGSLDYPDHVLRELDFVIASIHRAFKQDQKTLTRRLVRAMEHPYVDLIAHPTGRLIGRRPPYPLDMEEVLQTAARTGTALELNANPNRWDLKPEWLRKAADYGVLVAVNTDAHTIAELEHMEFGVGVARKGWLKTENVLNTKSLSSLKHTLKRARFSH